MAKSDRRAAARWHAAFNAAGGYDAVTATGGVAGADAGGVDGGE